MATDDVLRYDLPYGASAPAIVDAEAGIRRLVARGDAHSYTMAVRVFDAADHRLLRAGVLLAHRLVDGEGEWYLAAPDWEPFLPAERVEAVGQDLPETFASLIRPFHRGAPLGPVAELECQRTEYQARGADNVVLAELRDERVTVTRGGLTTARYREVTLTPREGNSEQLARIDEALLQVGGAQTVEFPSFVARLGAPATGQSDLSRRQGHRDGDTTETWVQSMLSAHLHAVMAADLAVLTGVGGPEGVRLALLRLRRDLRGLYPLLDATWLGDLLGDIDQVVAASDQDGVDSLGEVYLTVLDRLVMAARSPRLGDVTRRPAVEVMTAELRAALATFVSRGEQLVEESPDRDWEQLLASAQNVAAIAAASRSLLGKKARRLARRMDKVVEELAWCAETSTEEPVEELEGLSGSDAFRRGRDFERDMLVQSVARGDFLIDWRRLTRRLDELAPR